MKIATPWHCNDGTNPSFKLEFFRLELADQKLYIATVFFDNRKHKWSANAWPSDEEAFPFEQHLGFFSSKDEAMAACDQKLISHRYKLLDKKLMVCL